MTTEGGSHVNNLSGSTKKRGEKKAFSNDPPIPVSDFPAYLKLKLKLKLDSYLKEHLTKPLVHIHL